MKTYAIVEDGAIIREWSSPRRSFEISGNHYHPGDSADDAWFQSVGVCIVTSTRDDYDSESEKLQPETLLCDDEAKTVTRTRSKVALSAQDLDDRATADIDRSIINSKAFKALALVIADAHGVTPAQMRSQLIAKYKTL